jgi:hypothetical protein
VEQDERILAARDAAYDMIVTFDELVNPYGIFELLEDGT